MSEMPRPPKRAYGLLPMVATIALFVAGSLIHVSNLGAGLTVAVALAVLVLFVGNSAGAAYAESFRLFMMSSGMASAVWLVLAGVDQLWRNPVWLLGSLTVGGLLATGPWQQVRQTQYQWRRRQAMLDEGTDLVGVTEADRWAGTFERAGLRGLTFVERVPHRAGFGLRVTSDTVTQSNMLSQLEKLETVTRLGKNDMPADFRARGRSIPVNSISVEPVLSDDGRPLAGEYLLTFDLIDVLNEVVYMPDDHSELSILEAFPVGRYSDGSTIYLSLNEVQTMVAGLTGSGKSMLLHVIIHQVSRCRDAVIWFADLKSGETAKLWMLAWFRRLMGAPLLDWVACDRFELERMLRAAHALLDARPKMHNINRVKVSPSRPAIILIVDEIAEGVGLGRAPRSTSMGLGLSALEMAGILASIVSKGRSIGLWVIGSGQRNSVSMFGSGDMISQMGQRVGFAGMEAQMIGTMFQGAPAAARLVRALIHQGSLVIWRALTNSLSIAKRGRSYFLGDDEDLTERIIATSIAHEQYLTELDEASAAVADLFGYADRWTDPSRLHWSGLNLKPATGATASTPAAPTHTATTEQDPEMREATTQPNRGFWAGKPRTVPAAPDNGPATGTDPEFDRLASHTARVGGQVLPFVPGRPAKNRYDYTADKKLLLEIVAEHPHGISNSQIIREMRVRGAKAGSPAINAWMQDYLSTGRLAQPGGERTSWFPVPQAERRGGH